jgi:hypothetical protein
MSMVPMAATRSPNPHQVTTYPDIYLSTGPSLRTTSDHGIAREAQDAFCGHQRAVAAMDTG